MELRFVKAQGAGNDFVILDESEGAVKDPARLARQLCPRRFGIGADGLLLVQPTGPEQGQVTFINADGSRAAMCGNGLRIAAHYLHRRHRLPATLRMHTEVGVRRCEVRCEADTRVAEVVVAMGPAETRGVAGGETWQGHPLEIGGNAVPAFAVSVGNRHLVLMRGATAAEVAELGPALSSHPAFVNGTNVEWVELQSPRRCRVEVFERGVGRTLACGSGACAVVAALVLDGQVAEDQEIEVELPGGVLNVTLDRAGQAWLRGPSQLVYEGVFQTA